MNVTVIGTVYVDVKGFPIGNFVPAGRNVGDIRQVEGGVGRNIAEDAASLGANTTFVGLVDQSGIGSDVIKHLQQRRINTDYMRATSDGMGVWLAVFDTEGEVCANVSKRPELKPICDILKENGAEIFQQSDAVLLEIDIDEEIVAMVFDLAAIYRVPVYAVISNMTIARERMSFIKKTSCFICNAQEAGILFEKESAEKLSPSEMLELMLEKKAELGIGTMIVTMDSRGSVFAGRNGETGCCQPQVVEVVDTTGAGDAFFAGAAVGLARGDSLAEACELGTEVASAVIRTTENVYIKN